jgi:hypothetical protein
MAWMLLLLTTVPYEPAVVDHFTAIHKHHFYDQDARHVFTQLLFIRWNAYECRNHAEAWRLTKPEGPVVGNGSVIWHDSGVLRKVTFDTYHESHGQIDIELEARQVRDKDHRKELSKPIRK